MPKNDADCAVFGAVYGAAAAHHVTAVLMAMMELIVMVVLAMMELLATHKPFPEM